MSVFVAGQPLPAAALNQAVVPPGAVFPYAGSSAPSGYLLCDGSAVSRTTYAALFAVVGTTYGAGNGTTTFNVPDLKGKMVAGYKSSETEFNALGKTGGSKTSTAPHDHGHAHDAVAVFGTSDAAHTHYIGGATGEGSAAPQNSGGGTGRASSTWAPSTASAAGASSTAATSGNLTPYMALNYIIRAA